MTHSRALMRVRGRCYGARMDAAQLIGTMRAAGVSLATAESLTGGQLAAAVTAVPGASAAYLGGVVSYATEVKVAVLGVPRDVVDGVGAVSAECAVAMARGVRTLLGASYGVSTTGVAGPEQQEGKPVGRVHLAVAGPSGEATRQLDLPGDRAAVQQGAVDAALALIGEMLPREQGGLR